jgi:hypothetical protein
VSRKLTELQTRVIGAITNEYATPTTVARRCGWGKRGCSRDICQIHRVLADLTRYGLIETNDQNRIRLREDSHALATHDHGMDQAGRT